MELSSNRSAASIKAFITPFYHKEKPRLKRSLPSYYLLLRIALMISIKMTAARASPVAMDQSLQPNASGMEKILRTPGSTVIP